MVTTTGLIDTPASADALGEVERIAKALAKADGLDFDEVCGVDADPDDGYCDSGTCVAAHWEEHDAEQARRWYMHLATAALSAMSPAGEVERLRERVKMLEYALEPFATAAVKGRSVYRAVKAALKVDPSLSTYSTAYIDAGRSVAGSHLSWRDFENANTALKAIREPKP